MLHAVNIREVGEEAQKDGGRKKREEWREGEEGRRRKREERILKHNK